MYRRRSGRTPMRMFLRYWLPVLVYVGVIAYLSSQPYLKPPIEFHESDKIYHTLEYGVLGLLLARAVRGSAPRARSLALALAAISLGILIGTGDEYLQSFIPGRESSAFDLLADTSGLVLAQVVFHLLVRD